MVESGGGGVRIEYMALGDVLTRRHEGNPKKHAEDDLMASIQRFGWVGSVLLDDEKVGGTGKLLAGHGRLKALQRRKQDGKQAPLRIETRDGEWWVPVTRGCKFNSMEEAEAYLLADNQLTIKGGYDVDRLLEMARKSFQDLGTLEGTGFDLESLNAIELEYKVALGELDVLTGDDGGKGAGDDEPSAGDISGGDLLSSIKIDVSDPRHVVVDGDVWVLHDRERDIKHLLICASVFTGWEVYMPHLRHGDAFIPYPSAFIPLTVKAEGVRLVMVQPDAYIAGHILDRFADVFGDDLVSKQGGGDVKGGGL